MTDPGKQRAPDIVVYSILRSATCAECGRQLHKGNWMRLEDDGPLCLWCADLDHLVGLSRGNAALTRRASLYSSLRAVLVRFSRARKRYERQGVLVLEPALARAEREVLGASEAQRQADVRDQLLGDWADEARVSELADAIRARYPGCPSADVRRIAERAAEMETDDEPDESETSKVDVEAIDNSARAQARRAHTQYDELLGRGLNRTEARAQVSAQVEEVLRDWR